MKRRSVLKLGTMAAAASAFRMPLLAQAAPAVRRVLLIAKCHLDVGFTQTQQLVKQKYFRVYYPQAIKTASSLRLAGGDRYRWTTGSWLLYEYLEQASPSDRQAMEQAVVAGDITWHALPFSWQTEMLTQSMIEGALGFSSTLDARFSRKTIGAKMTDVPGHSRGIIAPLASAGIRLLDIGVNAASTPPDVPDVFLWKDPAGNSLVMLYHRHDYGGTVAIPGTDAAVAVEVRGDNSGPHTPAEIAAMYTKLRAQFSGAVIEASDLNEVAAVVEPVRASLPVVTEEIGDTWIYGVASDPVKVAQYREAVRTRQLWLDQGRLKPADATDRLLLQRLLLGAEHTWGTDTKSYLDNDHYRPRDLAAVLGQPGYQTMVTSWAEKHADITDAAANLPTPLRTEYANNLDALRAVRPSTQGMKRHDPAQAIDTPHCTLKLDSKTGAITRLHSKMTGQEWASPTKPLALFTYQTLSPGEYATFLAGYIKSTADWAPRDFGKPNIASFGATAREWHPRLQACWIRRTASGTDVLLELAIIDDAALAAGNTAWPRSLYVVLHIPTDRPELELDWVCLGKEANRMPEAMWLSFDPFEGTARGWSLDKVNAPMSPLDVVSGGGRSMHAVSEAVRYTDAKRNTLTIHTLDTPLVAVGSRSPLNFSLDLPSLANGVHFGLYNNAWGTNYVQWAGGDWRYRFCIAF